MMKRYRRHIIQTAATLLQNPFIPNFFTGGIYRGAAKHICVPGLNCYSCPGAAGACPIGAIQSVIGGRSRSFSYYAFGTVLLFGTLFGRLICGFLCPFGFIQELLHKIPSPKPKLPAKLDRIARFGKYAALAAVLILPAILTDAYGIGAPFFCKYICPAGTLEGGIPLALTNTAVQSALGFLFSWKMFVLLLVLVGSVFICRPFCKYLCPLGAFYGLLNRFSVYRMEVDAEVCVGCGKCERECKMGVKVRENINSPECIRCGECREGCPAGAIGAGFIKVSPIQSNKTREKKGTIKK